LGPLKHRTTSLRIGEAAREALPRACFQNRSRRASQPGAESEFQVEEAI